jgi:hypothetical protein
MYILLGCRIAGVEAMGEGVKSDRFGESGSRGYSREGAL